MNTAIESVAFGAQRIRHISRPISWSDIGGGEVMVTVFVSYTRSNVDLVRALADDLQLLGQSVWMDHQIHGGEPWWREIIHKIQGAAVFVFALSNDSWKSEPCRRELEYAEKLGLHVLPVQVGDLDSMYIPLAEKQIVDYRGRSADAVLRLVSALREMIANPPALPDPLPEPPKVPFEYLFRIASMMGVNKVSPDEQEQLISLLRSKLKQEKDDVARADIMKLLRELRERKELTIQNAEEIDDILKRVEAVKAFTPEDGATRLPPADHWRRSGAAGTSVPVAPPERPTPPQAPPEPPRATPEPPKPPTEQPKPPPEPEKPRPQSQARKPPEPQKAPEPPAGPVPAWLSEIVQRGGEGGTPPRPQAPAAPAAPQPTARWWTGEPTAQPAAPTQWAAPPPESPSTPRTDRFAFIGTVLGVLGIPFLLLALANDDSTGLRIVVTALLIVAGLGLSISVVSATRNEPRSRIAIVLGVLGLLGVIVFTAVAGVF